MNLRAIAVFLLVSSGCGASREAAIINQSDRPVIFEGLPHPLYETTVLAQEKAAKPTVEFGEYAFYRDPLAVGDRDVAALKTVLGDRATYQAFSGEKKCGGFHPDFAVEWTHNGQTYRALICFGCGEIIVKKPNGETRFDLDGDAKARLKAILRPYRKNRPQPWHGPADDAKR